MGIFLTGQIFSDLHSIGVIDIAMRVAPIVGLGIHSVVVLPVGSLLLVGSCKSLNADSALTQELIQMV